MPVKPRKGVPRIVEIFYSAFGLSTPMPALTTGRYGHAADVTGNQILVVGGSSQSTLLNDIELIDLTTGAVTTVPTTLALRRYHCAHAIGGSLYVFGGEAPHGVSPRYIPDVEIYDMRTGTVRLASPLPTPRRLCSSVHTHGGIYVLGGRDTSKRHLPTLEVYDIGTDTWATAAPMPTARECATIAAGGKILAVGGYDGHRALRTLEAYDIASDTWQSLPDMPLTLSAHRIVPFGDYLFAFGDYSTLGEVVAFNTATGGWSVLTDCGYLPSRHNATVAAGGYAYVLGGNIASLGSALPYIQALSLQALAG